MNLDYLPYLRDKVVMPLVKEGNSGIPEAVSVMNSYHFIREDLDSLVELSHWPEQKDVLSRIDTKVVLNIYMLIYFLNFQVGPCI